MSIFVRAFYLRFVTARYFGDSSALIDFLKILYWVYTTTYSTFEKNSVADLATAKK